MYHSTHSILMFMFFAIIFSFVQTSFAQERKQLHHLPSPGRTPRFPLSDFKFPEKYGEGAICLWKDDKVSVVSITMDVPADHKWWIEQGKKYEMHFTWFIVSGLVSENARSFFGTWAVFANLLKEGHDVQSHTTSHRNKEKNLSYEEEYGGSVKAIEKNLPGNRCHTLAYPGGGLPNDEKEAMKYFNAARGARGSINQANRIDYTSTYSMSARLYLDPSMKINIPGTLDPKYRFYRGWYCTHFHGLKDQDKENVINCLEFLKANKDKIWTGTFREVTMYGQERDTGKIQTISATPQEIKLVLTDDMSDKDFYYPLTVKVRLNEGWKELSATQGQEKIPAKIVENEGGRYAMIEAVPDRGEIVLVKR